MRKNPRKQKKLHHRINRTRPFQKWTCPITLTAVSVFPFGRVRFYKHLISFVLVRNITLFFILMFLVFATTAQIEVDAKATGKHAKAINTAKETREEAKERRKEAKELKKKVKERKKARKKYKAKYDSARNRRMDSLNIKVISKEDSLQIAKEIFEETDLPEEYKELLEEPIALDSTSNKNRINDLDSVALKKGEKIGENVAKEYMPDELGEQGDPLKGLSNPAPVLGDIKPPSKPNPNLIKPEAAKELFEKIDPEQFKDAQANLQKLKKKYSKLPDSRYPEEGTKRNSLEKIPFKKRLYFGGNVSLQSTDPLILNTNLQLGYWINKKWMAGVGFILREQFNKEDTTSMITGDGHGFSLFTRYDITKGFFAWAEGEFQVNKSFFGSGDTRTTTSTWERAYLLGIGREFKIGKVQLMSTMLYDFNYQNNDLNARPLVFRMGFRIGKKPD